MGEIGRLTPAQLDVRANNLYPWTIFIDPLLPPKSNVNFDTLYQHALLAKYYELISDGTQNDEITWDMVLSKGTWTFSILTCKSSSYGIFSIQFDGVEKGTIDTYNSGDLSNTILQVTGIVVPTTKKIELKLKMATKHASSSGYMGVIQSISLIRTA